MPPRQSSQATHYSVKPILGLNTTFYQLHIYLSVNFFKPLETEASAETADEEPDSKDVFSGRNFSGLYGRRLFEKQSVIVFSTLRRFNRLFISYK